MSYYNMEAFHPLKEIFPGFCKFRGRFNLSLEIHIVISTCIYTAMPYNLVSTR